jgi:hypothetical protein
MGVGPVLSMRHGWPPVINPGICIYIYSHLPHQLSKLILFLGKKKLENRSCNWFSYIIAVLKFLKKIQRTGKWNETSVLSWKPRLGFVGGDELIRLAHDPKKHSHYGDSPNRKSVVAFYPLVLAILVKG